MWFDRCLITAVTVIAVGCGLLPTMAEPASAGQTWWQVENPTDGRSQVFGKYSRGCLNGGETLAGDGPEFQIMRPSRNRFYGHPSLIHFVRSFAASVRQQGWDGLLVGDLAQPRGGPMKSGHASHQTGLDVDIWFRPAPGRALTRQEREDTSAISMLNDRGLEVNGHWTEREAALLRTAARNPRVARIFVNPAIKRSLCRTADGDRAWLRKIRPWWGHDHHFHVRLHCPDGDTTCSEQEPPPPGDGCDDGLAWWFSEDAMRMVEERKKHKPSGPPTITLADLPSGCRNVLLRP